MHSRPALFLALALGTGACGETQSPDSMSHEDHHADAGPEGGGEDAGSTPTDWGLRLAHFAGAEAPFDFCLRSEGETAFQGPLLQQVGRPEGLAYGDVSAYFPPPDETVWYRLVAPGSADCETPLEVHGASENYTIVPRGVHLTLQLIQHWNGTTPGYATVIPSSDGPVLGVETILVHVHNATPRSLDFWVQEDANAPRLPEDSADLASFGITLLSFLPSSARRFDLHRKGAGDTLLSTATVDMSEDGATWALYAFGDPATDGRVLLCKDGAEDGPLSTCQ